jgi:maltooligosyltrehalose trehalohydrolase
MTETDGFWHLPLSAQMQGDKIRFRVWAEKPQTVEVVLFEGEKEIAAHPLQVDEDKYWVTLLDNLGAGTQYMYRLDGKTLRPDPVSRYQPKGVHGVSEVIQACKFKWTDANWRGIPASKIVLYEAHVGTFTPEGTFNSFMAKLDYLKDLGVNTIEIMPLSAFPGERGWGYDGVYPFAPAQCYGHPDDFKKLIDEAHKRGLAIILDVVYNHFGPDGCYLRDYSQEYFTKAYSTPWGEGINFAHPQVRYFFVQNALYWAHEFHLDGFRLDATHAIQDDSPVHILAEIQQAVQSSLPPERHFVIYAEDNRNEVRLIEKVENGGYGLQGLWGDDYHHQIRVALAKDHEGYYKDFTGTSQDIAATINKGWFYEGQFSEFEGKPRGTPAAGFAPDHFVHFIQNHDQIGNRAVGDRLNHNITPAEYRAAAALLLLGAYPPMLFQGQEWAASAPFQYFTDHNPELGKLVTEGRRAEFAHFASFKGETVPDPQAETTFLNSKLKWDEITQPPFSQVLQLHKDLLKLRCNLKIFHPSRRGTYVATALNGKALVLNYHGNNERLLVIVNFNSTIHYDLPEDVNWQIILNSENEKYGGQGEKVLTFTDEQVTLRGVATVALKG